MCIHFRSLQMRVHYQYPRDSIIQEVHTIVPAAGRELKK